MPMAAFLGDLLRGLALLPPQAGGRT
jgi:hypothetical protein